MCNYVNQKYTQLCNKNSDINEHLPTLKKYSEMCDVIVEFGVRSIVSTWAFLAGSPQKVISYDIKDPSNWGGDINEVKTAATECGILFTFNLQNVLETNIESCDLLFIDTLHEYDQLKKELILHGNKSSKYIILHDTTLFRTVGELGGKGLYPAISEYLDLNKHWKIKEEYFNNNGLLVLERIEL